MTIRRSLKGHDVYTPMGAYHWLDGFGLSHDDKIQLIASREKFEYFVAVLDAICADPRLSL